LIAAGVQPEATIKFVTFAAEEYGLHGSYDFAQKASTSGMDIRLMINHDMISHTLGTPGNWEVDLNAYIGFEYFRELARDLILQYTNLLPRNGSMNSGGSDSYSFYSFGFPAFYFEEHDFSPYYHSPQDIISNYDMDFCAEVIKASAALLVYSTEYPQAVQDYQIVDRGNGNSLRLTWTSNPEPDIAGYYIYLGTTAGHYDTSFTATSAPYQINQLTTGVEYFIGISAFDTDGNESMVVEKSAVPRVIPQSPTNVYDEPALQQITIHWSSNDEYDILGYNLYRSEAPGGTPVQLNTTVIEDTFFIDATTQNGVYYYYTATAVDSALNESDPSPEIRSRAVSLDQGILVVDETADGDGSLFNPTDQEVDDFYRQLLDDFQVTEYDVAAEGGVKLADLGAFSSVVWHGNDFSDLSAPYQNLEAIKEYLDFGGNLLISSYFPSQAFADNSSYPADFLPGDFMYDYLKINHVDYSIPARFFGAASLIGNYDSVYVDTIKTAAIPDLHLFKIESISASGEGTEIFSYDSQYPPSNPKGSMNGMPVGVEYIGTDFKTITLSYPLFYINPIQAQDLVTEVMLNKFSEPTPISQKQQQTPGKFSLEQNYPNPFNPTTTIRYNLAEATAVVLKIYNILGQEVLTLINEKQTAGEKSIVWNGRNRFGQKVSSGIYIYQLQAGEYLQSRKMVLLR
ncbi:MAG: M28 family peptidase, partial [Aliifodinibius sp.]|nr:M28 family peptidase [candidate division Zixibacteria bacterium]NIT61217.1 M28 family peptidase [Fodinibius sp.]NIS48636.1 M28 family peptidase [candidate division Zixibacteria bacterium]NIU16703.1 M28 family peptidase [candidate division Zixibacteria bacterium]NIV08871.1 M28 family peptidase [candidate division Zixibacteria bacterium]